MASAASGTVDLCDDRFDLANFPSLPFPVDNDDLDFMARMNSLFDPSLKEGSAHNNQAFSQPLQIGQIAAQTSTQPQQVLSLKNQPVTAPLPSTQGFSSHSQPMSHQRNPAQPLSSQQPVMSLFSTSYLQTGIPMQHLQTPFALNSNTSFDSEASQQKFVKTEQSDREESDQNDTHITTPRRSSRKRNTTELSRNAEHQQEWLFQQRKKVGRPITYNGDPNAPELSEAERRRVKRRIANRESARRVQQRRKEMIDELQHKLLYVQHHHHHLMQHLSKMELEKGQLIGQVTDMKARCIKSQQDNAALKAQVAALEQKFVQQQQQDGQQQQLQAGQQWPEWIPQSGPPTPQQAFCAEASAHEPFVGCK